MKNKKNEKKQEKIKPADGITGRINPGDALVHHRRIMDTSPKKK